MWSARAAVHRRHHDDDRLHPRQPGRQPCRTRSRSARRTGTATAPATTRSTSWWKARCRWTCRASLAEAIQAGFPTVKIFTTDITPSRKGRMVDFGDIWEVFQVLATKRRPRRDPLRGQRHRHAHVRQADPRGPHRLRQHGGGAQHAVGGHLVPPRASGWPRRSGHRALHDARLGRDRRVARSARRARAACRSTASCCTSTCSTRQEDYKRPNGQIYHTYPSLKSAEDQAALWAGTLDGSINCVATDEICCTLAKKPQGVRIDDTTGGNAGVEPRVALMYTEMVGRRGYTLRQFVDLVSTNAAKIMGLYPRKGALAPGSDADICVLDPARQAADPRRGPARGRLHALGRPQDGGVAVPDHPARQGGGGGRPLAGRRARAAPGCRAASPPRSAPAPRCSA